ncbi:hypothetical protein BDZ97DRAFT_1799095, partial [Flammula alnicola]
LSSWIPHGASGVPSYPHVKDPCRTKGLNADMSRPRLTGIHLLPYEILFNIFLECLPKEPLDQKQPDATRAPMLICHVCSSWRLVALTTPQLWAHIYHKCLIPSKIPWWDILKKGVRERDVEFLCWWLANVKPFSPFIRLEFEWSDPVKVGSELIC